MRRIFFAVFLLLPTPLIAQSSTCMEHWLTRNLLYDRAGQCLASPLGQAVFDNSDCTQDALLLTGRAAEVLDGVQMMEGWADCQVDTNTRILSVEDAQFLERLRQLEDLPIRGETEHGCIGYTGPTRSVYAAMDRDSAVIGALEPGMSYGLQNEREADGWEFLELYQEPGVSAGFGWVPDLPFTMEHCEMAAG